MIYKYTLKNGITMTSKLSAKEIAKRLEKLNIIRALTEQHECEEGSSIYKKAIRAYYKENNFTGIIRLTVTEKDWLSYMMENDMLDEDEKKVVSFYIK